MEALKARDAIYQITRAMENIRRGGDLPNSNTRPKSTVSSDPILNDQYYRDLSPKDQNRDQKEEIKSSFLGSVLGKIWSLPTTLIGLTWGLIGVPFGARIGFGNNAIEFKDHPFMSKTGAITIGNTIAYGEHTGPEFVGDHERQHTYQAEALGPLYLPAHLFEGVEALINDGSWHGESNDLESGPMDPDPKPW